MSKIITFALLLLLSSPNSLKCDDSDISSSSEVASPSFAQKIVDAQQQLPNSTVYLDCNFNIVEVHQSSLKSGQNFPKIDRNSKNGGNLTKTHQNFFQNIHESTSHIDYAITTFRNCQPSKILTNKKFLETVSDYPSTFLVTFEIDTKLKNFTDVEVQKIEVNLVNFHQNLLVMIYDVENGGNGGNNKSGGEFGENGIVNSYQNYLFKNGRLTRLETVKSSSFSLGNFLSSLAVSPSYDLQSKIDESLTENCFICLRILQLFHHKTFSKSIKIQNGPHLQKFHFNIDCFRTLLSLSGDFKFLDVPEHLTLTLHEEFVKSIRETTEHALDVSNNTTMSDFLDKYDIKMNLEGLTTLAFQQQQFKVLEFLIRADCPFPQNFTAEMSSLRKFPTKNRYVQKLQNYIQQIHKFHDDIKNGKVAEVNEFLTENKNFKFGRNEENLSAMQVAFESEQLGIFAMLKGHGMALSSLEELAKHYEMLNTFNTSTKTQIRRNNYKYLVSTVTAPNYIEKLIQQSKMSFDPIISTKSKIIDTIRNALTDINQTCPDILKTAAMSDDLTIIWDFGYTVVDEFEPGTDAVGLAQRQYDYVVIAASHLLSDIENDRNYVLGTTVHELTHYVMYLIYDNEAKPYATHDFVSKELFKKFTEICKENEDLEPHLAYPDESEPDEFHEELIARVPDILLMNRHRPQHLKKVKKAFVDLFDFFENKTLVDVRDMTETMSDREKVRELNQWLDLVRQLEAFEVEIVVSNENVDCGEFGENGEFRSGEIGENSKEEINGNYQNGINDDDPSGSGDLPGIAENHHSNDIFMAEDENDSGIVDNGNMTTLNVSDSGYENHDRERDNETSRAKRSSNHQYNPKIEKLSVLKNENYNLKYQSEAFIETLGLGLSTHSARHMILTNFPKAIEKSILKAVKESKILVIFMEISSYLLDNFHKVMDEIGNLDSDVLLVIEVDEIDYVENIVELLDGFSFSHVIFVSDLKNLEDLEDQKMEIVKIEISWTDLCPKSQELLASYNFNFQKDEMELGEIIGSDREILKKFPVEKIYSQEVYSIGEEPVEESEEIWVERSLIDEHGNALRLRNVIFEVYGEKRGENIGEMVKEVGNEDNAGQSDRIGNFERESNRKLARISKNSKRNLKKSQNFKNSTKTSQHNLKNTTIILSDIPGSGKSATLHEIALKIREISPKIWTIFINLEQTDITSFNGNLTSFLIEDVLDLPEIDGAVLSHFIKTKRVTLLFDEFDKIDKNAQKIAIKIFKICEILELPIWITTRPKNLRTLELNLKSSKKFKFAEFSKHEREIFLEFFDENLETQILEFFEQIGKVGSPQMLKEIADIFGSHENITNWYQIYSQLVLSKNFESSVKASEILDIAEAFDSPKKLLKAHQADAILNLYGLEILKSLNLKIDAVDISENYGIVFKSAKNHTEFVHSSYATFFTAQYFIENLLKVELPQREFESNWKVLIHATKAKSWQQVGKFISHFMDIHEDELDDMRFLRVHEVLKGSGILDD